MTKTIDALVEAALKRAFALGQTYWQQADSDFTSHHKKAEATRQNFLVVCEETLAALAQARAEQAEPAAFVSPLQFEQRLVDPEGEFGTYIPMRKTNAGKFTQPLFTTPPPAPVAKLEPLPIENIEELAEYHGLDHMTVEPFVRAVEAAHNAKLSK